MLNQYYTFDEKTLHYVPSLQETLLLELTQPSYQLDFQTSPNVPNAYMRQFGKEDVIIKNFKHLRDNRDDMFKEGRHGYIHFWSLAKYLNPYTLLTFNDTGILRFRKFKDKTDNDIQTTLNNYIQKKSKKLTLYKSFLFSTYRLYYTLKTHVLLLQKRPIKALFLFHIPDLVTIEDIFLYRENILNDAYNNDTIDVVKIFNDDKAAINRPEKIVRLKEVYNFNYIDMSDTFCNRSYTEKAYDFMFVNSGFFHFKYKDDNEYSNAQNFFSFVLLSLQCLNKGGAAVINIGDCFTEITTDIIQIASNYFEKAYLEQSPLQAPLRMYRSLILINFKGVGDEELQDLITIRQKWLTYIPDCGETWSRQYNKYVSRILKDNDPLLRKQLTIFNMCQKLRISNIIRTNHNFLKKFNSMSKDDAMDFFKKHIDQNMIIARQMLTKLDIPIYYEKVNKNPELLTTLIENPLFFEIPRTEQTPITNITTQMQRLLELKRQLMFVKRTIDTRDPTKYQKLTKDIKIFKNIKKHVKTIVKMPISQAFLKMWEILHVMRLIPTHEKGTFNTFSLCEAPGQFIVAINHFLKTRTKFKNYKWYANTLNPKTTKSAAAISDVYGLMQKHPKRWLFGKDGTGDIMNIENIEDMKLRMGDVDLITSDCGMPICSSCDFNRQEQIMAYLNFCQVRAILYILPLNKHAVFKTFLPMVLPINVSLIYVLYTSFKQVFVYKPQQNPSSSEVYVICKHYNGCDSRLLKRMFKVTQSSFNEKKLILPIGDQFIVNYSYIISELIEKNITSIKRTLNVYDKLYQDARYRLFIEHLDKYSKQIIEKWISQFKFKK